MAVTYGTGNIASGTSASPTLTVTLTAGQSVAFAIVWSSGVTFSSIGSALGNTYTQVGSEMSAFGSRMRVYRAVNVAGGSETITVNLSGSDYSVRMLGTAGSVSTTFNSGNGPVADAASPWTGTNVTPGIADAIIFSFATNDTTNNSVWTAGNGFTKTMEDGDGSASWPIVMGYKIVASTSADGGSWTSTQGTNANVFNVVFDGVSAGAATLSSPTPSGTLGTSTTATLGATTDTTSGTFYTVVEATGALLVGITATQIKAGNNNLDAAADAAGNAAVSTTTPSVGVSGLTASTAYSYASVQNSAGGDSNIVTGTFTTAAAGSAPRRMMLLGVG